MESCVHPSCPRRGQGGQNFSWAVPCLSNENLSLWNTTKDSHSGQVGEESPESSSGLLQSHLAKPFSHTEGDMNVLCEQLEASVTNLAVRGPSRGPGLGHHCLIPAGQALHSQTAAHRQHWSLSLGLGTEEVCPREPSKEESEPGRDPWDPVSTTVSVPRLEPGRRQNQTGTFIS